MRALVAAVAVLGLAGCAAAATQNIRTTGTPAEEWVIHGHQNPVGTLTISINAQPVIKGKISLWSGDGEFTGDYNGRAVAVTCSRGEGQVRTRCVVFVEGQKLTTLHFKVL